MRLEFDKASHKYSVCDTEIPSVTQILSWARETTDYSGIPEWVLKRAGQIGDTVHVTINRSLEHGGILFSYDHSANPYLDAYVDFDKEHTLEPWVCEQRMYCTCHGYAGTVDIVGKLDGVPTILDIKTTNVLNEDYVSKQTAGYQHLVKLFLDETFDETFFKRAALHLTKHSQQDLVWFEDESDWVVFEQMVHDYWNEHGGNPLVDETFSK
jgi:hypothetical protein